MQELGRQQQPEAAVYAELHTCSGRLLPQRDDLVQAREGVKVTAAAGLSWSWKLQLVRRSCSFQL